VYVSSYVYLCVCVCMCLCCWHVYVFAHMLVLQVCIGQILTIFTTLRCAKRGICRRHVSVCVSVTLRYCIKTAKHRITQIMPQDSPGNLVF